MSASADACKLKFLACRFTIHQWLPPASTPTNKRIHQRQVATRACPSSPNCNWLQYNKSNMQGVCVCVLQAPASMGPLHFSSLPKKLSEYASWRVVGVLRNMPPMGIEVCGCG